MLYVLADAPLIEWMPRPATRAAADPGILMHEPSRAMDESGLRDWDHVMEDEANFIPGALLVTDQVTVIGLRNRQSVVDLAIQYGVSTELMQWRINATGAVRRVARGARWR